MPKTKPIVSPEAERFKNAMRKILSVPKDELIRREAEYKKQRRNGKVKRG